VVSDALGRQIAQTGFAFVHAAEMREALAACGSLSDWPAFAASWNDLEIDPYLAEHGRYRRRRFGVYAIDARGSIARQPHAPHYQGRQYNQLFGGVERWFEPILPAVSDSASMQTILRWTHRLFSSVLVEVVRGPGPSTDRLKVAPWWHVEAHQFRIEARADMPGQPTPEGVHRDGVDFVLVLLVNRQNIVSGTTTVFDLKGTALGSFTLTDPLDAALVDDNRVAHGVTPVAPLDPALPAHRDVLVVTFRSLR
jgi:hypothetical protein